MRVAKPIIGLAGGIGSGKSTVASILGTLGAGVVASDRLNHEELNSPEMLARLREWWGEAALGRDGHADRDALRRVVTTDPEARRRLEGLVHPRIARRTEELMARHQADPGVRAIVWDAPLLFEVGLADACQWVIFVETDESIRRQRVLEERGWAAEDFERFEKAQVPLDVKRAEADYVIVNNSDMSDLRRQVEDVFSRILAHHEEDS